MREPLAETIRARPAIRCASLTAWAADRGAAIREQFGIGLDILRPEGTARLRGWPADEWNEQKIKILTIDLRPHVAKFMAAAQKVAAKHGAVYVIWDAARSLERQLDLYRHGRTDKGAIVTHAIASRHLWGRAVDLILRARTGQPIFDLPPWHIRETLPLAAKHGLSSLYLTAGIDPPHVEAPLGAAEREAARLLKADFAVMWKRLT